MIKSSINKILRIKELKCAQQLQQSQIDIKAQTAKLRLLQDYTCDVKSRQAGILINQANFNNRMSKAIQSQQQQVKNAELVEQHCYDLWLISRNKYQAIERIQSRRAYKMQREQQKRQQNQINSLMSLRKSSSG